LRKGPNRTQNERPQLTGLEAKEAEEEEEEEEEQDGNKKTDWPVDKN